MADHGAGHPEDTELSNVHQSPSRPAHARAWPSGYAPLLRDTHQNSNSTVYGDPDLLPSHAESETVPEGHNNRHGWSKENISKLWNDFFSQSTFFIICDFLGAPIIYHFFVKRLKLASLNEEPKVVMHHRSWGMVALRNLVHLLPFGAALALVLLNTLTLYIGGEMSGASGRTTEKLFALQLTAKVHELLMITSLTTIVATYIRKELVFGEGLPYGVVFSPHSFNTISFLLSGAFSGMCFQKWQKKARKHFLIWLIIICAILSVWVGPASTLLIRPRLGEWNGGGTWFWVNATENQLYPVVMNDSQIPVGCLFDSGDLSCPSGNWETIEQLHLSYWPQVVPMSSMPANFQLSGRFSERTFRIKPRKPHQGENIIWAHTVTLASAPLAPVADAVAELGRLWSYAARNDETSRLKYRENAFFRVNALQPMVLSQCNQLPRRARLQRTFPMISNATTVARAHRMSKLPLDRLSGSISKMVQDARGRRIAQPSVTWIDEPSLMKELRASIASIVIVPKGEVNDVYCCSNFAAWMPSQYEAAWSLQKTVGGWPGDVPDADPIGLLRNVRSINITESWANYLYPVMLEKKTTVVSSMARAAGLWNTTTPSPRNFAEPIVETILAAALTNGLARTGYYTQLRLDLLKEPTNSSNLWKGGTWAQELLQSSQFNRGRKKGHHAFDDPQHPERNTKINFKASVYGMAYSTDGNSVKSMLAVLCGYMLVVLAHLASCIVTRWVSAKWGSSPEVAVLIMTAKQGEEFDCTGAGIETLKPYEAKVQVKDVDGKLTMFIGEEGKVSQHVGDVKDVKPNEKYR